VSGKCQQPDNLAPVAGSGQRAGSPPRRRGEGRQRLRGHDDPPLIRVTFGRAESRYTQM
jgi:hypothetical protein